MTIFQQVCQTLAFAHSHGVIHRDLKPSNIMVGQFGEVLVIDWGLSKSLLGADLSFSSSEAASAAPSTVAYGGDGLTVAGALIGTAAYMAPEQARGEMERVDKSSDVFSLGAILCEILTDQPPYLGEEPDVLAAARCGQLDAAHARLDAASDRELAGIAKAWLAPRAEDRPREAAVVVQELNAHQARAAQRLRDAERAANETAAELRAADARIEQERKTRRVIGISSVVIAAVMVLLGFYAWASHVSKRELARRRLLEKQLAIRAGPHSVAWSMEALRFATSANELESTQDLREPVAAALAGIDAKLATRRENLGVSAIAWSADGKTLLLGGASNPNGKPSHEGRIWNVGNDADILSGLRGEGPVAWRPDGTAIQAVVKDPKTIVIWDVRAGQLVREAAVPNDAGITDAALATLSRDGTTLAVAASTPDAGGRVVAWQAATGECILDIPCSATALAVSPRGELVAAGDADGRIRVWARGRTDAPLTLPAAHAPIDSLAFGRDASSDPGRQPNSSEESALLLATSDAGGRVTIWDLALAQPRTSCTGSLWDVSHIAFSPDGATLATGGRQKVLLWDIATGRRLLELRADDTVVGLDFSRDGQRLAIAADDGRGNPAGLVVYEVLERRGLQLLRGLGAPVIQVRFSRDAKYVAAISSDWQLGVWEAATGHLRRVLRVPKGMTADNAGFVVSPDGEQIAFATSGAARLWEIETGKELRRWKLHPGIQDQLAFHSSGKLLLVRAELKSGIWYGGRDPEADPLVCRIYDLLADDGDLPRQIAPDVYSFNQRVNALVFSPHGEHFVVDGYEGPGDTGRHVAAFDALTGKLLWRKASKHDNPHSAALCIDPLGTTVSVAMGARYCDLFDVRTGKHVGNLPANSGSAIGPGGRLSIGGKNEYGYTLYQLGLNAPFTLGIDSLASSYVPSFNSAATHVAWGNADGTVTLCEIDKVRKVLSEIGLGW